MDRQETVLVLKELMTYDQSFFTAKAVSMAYKRVSNSWEFNASWLPHPLEIECLNKIVAKHSLERVTTNEHTVFRSL